MLRRFGWFYRILGLGRALSRLRLEEHSVDRVRLAAERGPVVYVLPRASRADFLALNTVLNQRRLPLSHWANGVTNFYWQPVVHAWTDVATRLRALMRLGRAEDPVRSGWLSRKIAAGATTTVFLHENVPWWRRLWGRPPTDPLQAVLDAQAACDEPIQLLPVMVAWDRAPEQEASPIRSFFLGSRMQPGLIARFREVYLGGDESVVQVGDPVNLPELIRRVPAERRVQALRILLRRYLRRESHAIRGPRLLPRPVLERLVLHNPPMRDLARKEARESGRPVEQVQRQMRRDFYAIAANFRFGTIRMLRVVLEPLWTRIYSGVDVREADMDRLRTAMREGTAILVPCHKSHVDYVLLSWVLYTHDMIVPHIIAGMNLAIWPLSIVMRQAGAIFIKRSFTGDAIFPAVFERTLRELIRQGYPIEFFIEGGRTRSGKLLPPRLGVLRMVIEAAEHRKSGQQVTLLPISWSYEQVAEEATYARELGGADKTPESMGEVLKVRSVLSRRFGRVYLRVGEPVRCSELVDAHDGLPTWSDRTEDQRRELLRVTGDRLVQRIGAVMVVLPTSLVAMALLAHPRRGIHHDALVARIHRLRALLARWEAPEAASLERADLAIGQALDRFLRKGLLSSFEDDGRRVWGVSPKKRVILDFYKNQVLHYLAPAALAAASVGTSREGSFRARELDATFARLVRLMRQEFVFDPDKSAGELLRAGLDDLVAHGALERRGGGWLVVTDPVLLDEARNLTINLLEAYVLVLESADRFGKAASTDALVKGLQDDAPELVAAGKVTRPEAITVVNLKNAVNAWRDEGVILSEGGKLRVGPAAEEALTFLAPLVAPAP